MTLGERIRKKRLEKGLSQEDLALSVGVTKSMIGQVERGTKSLSVQLCKEIAKELNCTLEDLAG